MHYPCGGYCPQNEKTLPQTDFDQPWIQAVQNVIPTPAPNLPPPSGGLPSVQIPGGFFSAPMPIPTPIPTPAPAPTTQVPAPTPATVTYETQRRLVEPIEIEGLETPVGGSILPIVQPKPPHFSVPSNPLLPAEYHEILSYENLQYMNGFLRTQIGRECIVSLAIGTGGTVAARLGYLIGVGVNYILLQDSCSEEITVCDFYSIRLVQILGKRCPVNLLI